MPRQVRALKLKQIKPIYLVLTVAFLLRLGWVVYTPALPTSDFGWYHHRAIDIAEGRGYTVEGVPTAHRLPGYSLFLAAIYSVFGRSLLAAQLMNVLLGTLSVYLTYLLALKVFSESIGLVSAALVTFVPSLILYTGLLASENLAIPLFLSSLVLYLHGLQTEKDFFALFAGLMLGLTVMIRPVVLGLPVLWLLYLYLRGNVVKKVVTQAVLLGLPILLLIVPWTVRNHVLLDHFIPLSTDSGSVLLISFNEESTGRYSVPEIHNEILQRAQEGGWDEYQNSQALRKEAFRFIGEFPSRAIALAPVKVFHLFRDDVSGVVWNFAETSRPAPEWLRWILSIIAQVYYVLVVVLALAAVFCRRTLTAFTWYGLLLTPILYWIVIHFFFFGDDRYHLPILPVIAIFSAFSLFQLVDSFLDRHRQRRPPFADCVDVKE